MAATPGPAILKSEQPVRPPLIRPEQASAPLVSQTGERVIVAGRMIVRVHGDGNLTVNERRFEPEHYRAKGTMDARSYIHAENFSAAEDRLTVLKQLFPEDVFVDNLYIELYGKTDRF